MFVNDLLITLLINVNISQNYLKIFKKCMIIWTKSLKLSEIISIDIK